MELTADGTPLPELVVGLSSAVRALARAAKNVPPASDIYYYKNIPEYRALSNDVSSKAQGLLAAAATHLTRPVPSAAAAGGASSTHQAAAAAAAAAGSTEDDEDVQFERLTSLLDDTYERLDTALDEAKASSAALKLGGWAVAAHNRQPLRAAARGLPGSSVARVSGGGRVRRHVPDLARPQDTFPDLVDNSEAPWSPAKFPHLAAQLAAAADSSAASSARAVGVHPYRAELGSLQYQPWQLQKQQQQADTAAAVDVMDLESVPVTLVDTTEGLAAMVSALEGVRQVALDLEHHAYRSYQGFTCLLQLSTREADWVVDTLALRDQLGPALAPLLADPGVEKVLHGADNDILWLQRDFGLYIVNLFDTGQAARVLAYPSASLAHLLERHTGFVADKRYQLADWRLRPLPQDMLAYARADTRFLLAVSDRLKDELRALGDRVPPGWATDLPPHSGATGSLGVVLERSRQLCLQQYAKPALTPMSHLEAALRWGLALPPRNMGVFGALFAWRDRTARALDESVHYVLPKGALIELARAMPTTGGDVRKLLGKASGLSGAAVLVLARADEVAQVIAQGQQQQQQQQPTPAEGATAAAATAAAAAAAAAAVIKPKELPAIAPRKVGAIAVKAVSVKPAAGGSSGVRGLFGKGGSCSSAQAAQQHQQQQQEPLVKDQQPGQPEQAEQPPEGQTQQSAVAADHQPPPPAAAASAAGAVGAAAGAAGGAAGAGGSLAAAKPLAPARKTSSSLGGLFSRKCPAAAAAAAAGAAAKKAAFNVNFLTVTQPDTAATDAGAGDKGAEAEAEAEAEAAAAAKGEQQGSMQGTFAAEIRAAVDQMMAEGEQSGEASEDEAAAAAEAAAADEADDGLSEDLEYVPLSQQGSVKKRRRQAAAAAAAGGSDSKQPKVAQAAGGRQNGGKRKGIFAGLGDDASGSSDDSDLEAGIAAMPSFDPNRPTAAAAAAAAAAGDSAAAAAAGEEEGDEEGGGLCGRGRGRGRGGRGSGGRRGGRQGGSGPVRGRGSLASVRRRGGGAVGGGGMFEVQDGPFKAARRKGVAGGKSRTFK